MAEKPDEYELDDYPERRYGEGSDNRFTSHEEEKFFQENSLRGENLKKFRIRQQMIKSNRVRVNKSFLKGSQTEVKILKRTILTDVLNIPYDDVDETKFDLMVEPVDEKTFKLYYGKNRPLLEYDSKDDRITILSKENLSLFKTEYFHQTTMRYTEKEMKSDFSTKKDLSVIDLEVRQAESEKYHRNLNRLQTRVNELENEKKTLMVQANQKVIDLQNQLQRARQQAANVGGYDYRNEIIRNLEQELAYTRDQIFQISSDKDQRIGGLMDQISRMKENTSDEIEGLNESLKLKSIQIIESQKEIEQLKENIENLEDEIRNSNKDKDKLDKELNENKEKYREELDRAVKLIDHYRNVKEDLEKALENDIATKQENIKKLIEEKTKAQKERDDSISFQESLESEIAVLKDSLEKYKTMHDVLKNISDDDKLQLDRSRNKITELENHVKHIEESNSKLIESYKRQIDIIEKSNIRKDEDIKSREELLDETQKNYEDIIKERNTEIESLISERETLEEKAANLNREIQRSENTNEVLTAQLDRVNNEIIELNGRIQEMQEQNQTLTTELDALRSNFGNLVAAAETTNHNNTLEIGRLKIKIKELEDNDDLNEQVEKLLESVDTYKGLLDSAVEDKKKLKKEFEEEFDKLNKEKESLVQDLKNKTKNEENLMKKLWQNENNYSLLMKKYEESFSNIYDLTLALDKTSEREKILEAELEYKESRVKVKDEEITEKTIEIEKLKKQIEDSNFNIKNSDFFQQQYEKTSIELSKVTSERNMYIQDLNRSKGDNEELEEEIQVLEKEIEVLKKERDLAKSKITPKEILDQMKHDNQALNEELNQKVDQLKELSERQKAVKNEHDIAMKKFNKLKNDVNDKINLIKESYEKELEISRKKLTKTISPGELKALNVFLEDLDIEDYDKVDYDTQIKKLRSAREKFKRLIDDPSTDRAHKLQYKYLDDLMQYRIDFLNIEFKKPIETMKGRDYLIRTSSSWSPLGLVRKILLAMKDNPGTTMSLMLTLVSNTAFGIFYFVSTSVSYSKKSVVNVTRKIVQVTRPIRPITVVKKIEPVQKIEPPSQKVKPPVQKVKPVQKVEPPSQKIEPSKKAKPTKDKTADVVAGGSILYNILSSIPSYALSFAEKLISFIDWTVQNFYKLILAGIVTSVTLYNMYGEQMSFPLLSFWSFVLAIAIVSMTTLVRVLPSWITG